MEITADGEGGAFVHVLPSLKNGLKWPFLKNTALIKDTKEKVCVLVAAQKCKTRVITVT